jgi:hypothetical protein
MKGSKLGWKILGLILFGCSLILLIPQEVSDINDPPDAVRPKVIAAVVFGMSRAVNAWSKTTPVVQSLVEFLLFALFVSVLVIQGP